MDCIVMGSQSRTQLNDFHFTSLHPCFILGISPSIRTDHFTFLQSRHTSVHKSSVIYFVPCACMLNCVLLFVTPWVVARHVPLSMEFSRQEYWSGSVQFSSVAQSCPTLCDPMNHSTPGLPVHNQLPEFTQTYVHRVSDAI